MRFGLAIDLLRFPILLFFPLGDGFQAFLYESSAKSFDCTGVNIDSSLDLVVGPVLSLWTLIRLQKDSCVPLFQSGRRAFVNQATEIGPLFSSKRDDICLLRHFALFSLNKREVYGERRLILLKSTDVY